MRVMVGVTLLESLPQTFVGMRSGVSFALVIVIVAFVVRRKLRARRARLALA
jgi:ABC-type nitrate/sulfonate/bicarbonate transport system permease component